MWQKIFRRWKSANTVAPKRRNRRARHSLSSFESLESRAMLTATPVGSELLVNDDLQASQRVVPETSDVAVSESGQSIVVYHGRGVSDTRLAGDDQEIFFQRYDQSGAEAGSLSVANEVTRGDQQNPSVDAAPDGSYWIAWEGRGLGDRHGIFARRFDADGTALTGALLVNQTVGGVQEYADIAVNSSGAATVVWNGVGGGDFDGIYGRQINADGTFAGDEFLINTDTAGEQTHAAVATDESGDFVVTWSSRETGIADWDILAQQFNADASTKGIAVVANSTTDGSQYGSQIGTSSDGSFVVAWNSFGQDGDSWGVFAQQFSSGAATVGSEIQLNETTTGHQQDVAIAVAPNGEFVAAWSSGEPNGNGWEADGRTFAADGSADGEVFAINRELAGADSGHQRFPSIDVNSLGESFAVFHGRGTEDHQGVFAQQYTIEVGPVVNVAPRFTQLSSQTVSVGETLVVDLVASDDNRQDTLTFTLEEGPSSATITSVDSRTARLEWTPGVSDRDTTQNFRIIVSDDGDPVATDAAQFIAVVSNAAPVVDLNGADLGGRDFSTTMGAGDTRVAAVASDATLIDSDQNDIASATITLRNPTDRNLEQLIVDTSDTQISDSYDPQTGILSLTGTDTTENYQRVLRTLEYENLQVDRPQVNILISVVANDGADNSAEAFSNIAVGGANAAPTLAAIENVTLLAGSPLHIPLVASDQNGDDLSFSITSSDPLVSTFVPEGNRSARVTVDGFGEMVFELFEQRAPRATRQIISLASEGFYDGLTFHRIIDGFVIQGGDPLGNGTGGSDRSDFDDQFHPDLQHNRTGILSMAKSADDTNNSQFFITDAPTRNLDSNHTIFGQLITGDDVRNNINNVPTGANDRPLNDVTISSFEIFTDTQNGVLMLSAPEGSSGSAVITVEVSDGNGGTSTQSFNVTVEPDTVNSNPYLEDIPLIQTNIDTEVTFQLSAIDVEGDPVVFLVEDTFGNQPILAPAPADLDVSVDASTGLLTIVPSNGLMGLQQFTVGVAAPDVNLDFPNVPVDFQVVELLIAPDQG